MVLAMGAAGGQAGGVPDIQDSARRWRGFVCPDCRFVFRVARDHDGCGVVCPSCRRLLKLPGETDLVPPLLAPQPAHEVPADTEESAGQDGQRVRRKSKRRRHREETADWESETREDDGSESSGRPGMVALAVGLLLLMVTVVAVVVIIGRDSGDGDAVVRNVPSMQEVVPEAPVDDPPAAPSRTLSQFVNQARTVASAFLNATTVDELLAVVAHPDAVEPRIRKMHPDGTVQPRGLADYSQFVQMETTPDYVIVQLNTADHLAHRMAFLEGEDGLKVDWESWVGWADLPMADFIEQRPAGRHLFRVQLGSVDYYNFDFADDRKWQSFRLRSPDGNDSLFGYAERGTPIHIRVREALDSEITHIIVEVEFPDSDAPIRTQVLITDVISLNWIHPERLEKP